MDEYVILHCKLHLCACVRPWSGSIWKQLLARALRHPQCLSHRAGMCLPPPFSFLSVTASLSLSLFFCLSVSTSLSPFPFFSHCTKLLSYEPQQRGKVKPPFRGNRNLCDILIQITYFQFAQTSPENTKLIRLNLMSWLRRCFCAYMCLCCMTKGHLRLRTLPPSGPCCVRLARTRNTAI